MEAVITNYNALPFNYVNMLLGMSDDAKLRVIRLLTDSLLNRNVAIEDKTQVMLKKHAGAWVGNESADEITSCIRENYSSRSPLEF